MQSLKIETVRALTGLAVLVVVTIGGYAWYQVAYSKCRVPIAYDIGTVDPRFNIKNDAIKSALADAESLWEDATGKNLFTYKSGASFKVNFVYDERQQSTNEQHSLTTILDKKAGMSASIKSEYNTFTTSYEALKKVYQANIATYEKKLAAHNAEVEAWNKKGGAPAKVFASLKATGSALNTESIKLNELAKNLNDLAQKINQIGDQGNKAVQEYNKDVSAFNTRYNTDKEFTQGDYQGDKITIYQFDSPNELRKVLAHELGHALSLDHVQNAHSIMHYVMEGKNSAFVLTSDDLAEYKRVCGTR